MSERCLSDVEYRRNKNVNRSVFAIVFRETLVVEIDDVGIDVVGVTRWAVIICRHTSGDSTYEFKTLGSYGGGGILLK